MPPEATATTAAAGATPAAGTTDGAGATPATPTAPAAGQAGSAGATPAAGTTPATTQDPDPQLGASGQSALAAERKAAADLKKQLDAVTKERDTLAAASMSELEKAQKKAADLERQLADQTRTIQENRLTAAAVSAGAKLGFANPDIVVRLIDRASVTFGEDGAPTNMEKLASDLLKAMPNLGSAHARPVGSQDFGSAGTPSVSLEQMAKSMTPQQFADYLAQNPQAMGRR